MVRAGQAVTPGTGLTRALSRVLYISQILRRYGDLENVCRRKPDRALASILNLALTIYMWVIIARALLSWVNPDPL